MTGLTAPILARPGLLGLALARLPIILRLAGLRRALSWLILLLRGLGISLSLLGLTILRLPWRVAGLGLLPRLRLGLLTLAGLILR